MIQTALIVCLIVIFIHLMLQEKEIFGFVGQWLKGRLPEKFHKPVFDCPICMTPWWGSIVMAVAGIVGIEYFRGIDTSHWLFTIAVASGMSTVYVGLKPKKKPKSQIICGTKQ